MIYVYIYIYISGEAKICKLYTTFLHVLPWCLVKVCGIIWVSKVLLVLSRE